MSITVPVDSPHSDRCTLTGLGGPKKTRDKNVLFIQPLQCRTLVRCCILHSQFVFPWCASVWKYDVQRGPHYRVRGAEYKLRDADSMYASLWRVMHEIRRTTSSIVMAKTKEVDIGLMQA